MTATFLGIKLPQSRMNITRYAIRKPITIDKVGKKFTDSEILSLAMIAELDVVSLYEQLTAATDNKTIREVLLDVAKEEKTHMGEFQAMLLREAEEQVEELKRGKEEVEKELGL